jgi:hypothetical protein
VCSWCRDTLSDVDLCSTHQWPHLVTCRPAGARAISSAFSTLCGFTATENIEFGSHQHTVGFSSANQRSYAPVESNTPRELRCRAHVHFGRNRMRAVGQQAAPADHGASRGARRPPIHCRTRRTTLQGQAEPEFHITDLRRGSFALATSTPFHFTTGVPFRHWRRWKGVIRDSASTPMKDLWFCRRKPPRSFA